jgi:hypothetical protein
VSTTQKTEASAALKKGNPCVNILAQILPGVREVRTPAVVGILWALALVALHGVFPEALPNGSALIPSKELRSAIPEEFQVALLSTLLYILGLVLVEFGRFFLQVFWSLWMLALLYPAWLFAIAILREPMFFVYLLLPFLVVSVSRWRSDPRGGLGEQMKITHIQALDWLKAGTIALLGLLIEAVNRPVEYERLYLADEVLRMYRESPVAIERLIDDLTPRAVIYAVESLSIELGDIDRGMPDVDVRARKKFDSLGKILVGARSNAEACEYLRTSIKARISRESGCLQSLVNSGVFDLTNLRTAIKARLDRAVILLRVNHQNLYDEYDRLNAEAEFRSGAALPLAVLVGSVSRYVQTVAEVSVGSSWIWSIAPCLFVFVLLQVAGKNRSNGATLLLYASLRQQIVEDKDVATYDPSFIQVARRGRTPRPTFRFRGLLADTRQNVIDRIARKSRSGRNQQGDSI